MSAPSIFPLPLTAFEEYMVHDDHRAYPMVFGIRLGFDGHLCEVRLRRALKAALARHPLLACTIRRTGSNRHVWDWHSDLPVDLMTIGDDTPHRRLGKCRTFPMHDVPSIEQSTGLRARIVRSAESGGDYLLVQFHHVCCDGGGAMQFLSDVFLAYHHDEAITTKILPPLDEHAIVRRDRRRLSWLQRLSLIPKQLFGIEGARKFFVRFPQSLNRQSWPNLNESPPSSFPTCIVAELEPNELQSIAIVARECQATTHEMITRELFLTICDYQESKGNLRKDGWLRLNIPMSLRRPEHRETSASNIVTMVFLDRKPSQMGDEAKLLRSIHSQMNRIKRFDVKYTYLYFSKLLQMLPGGFSLVSRSRKCHATMVLTNLGAVFRETALPRNDGRLQVHDLQLVSVDLSAPYRPLCNAAIAIMNYNDCMSINLHFDPRAMSCDDAQSLCDRLQERLRNLVTSHQKCRLRSEPA